MKIVFFDSKSYDEEVFRRINKQYQYDLRFFKEHLNIDTVSLANGADVVCIFVNDSCDKAVIKALCGYGVRMIALRCAGYNNVDLVAAEPCIKVVRVPAYSPHAVAEFTVGMMLALNRKIARAVVRTRSGDFSLQGLMGFDMYGRTCGIMGTGRIAQCVIPILHGMGMKILAYDLSPDKDLINKYQVEYCTLSQFFRQSDIISLHCPLTAQTRYVINHKSIEMMKKGVMIVNTGRGRLIHSKALIDGLKSGKIGYAALDVYEEESDYFYEDCSDSIIDDDVLARLLSFNNVLVTSHQAFFTREAMENIAITTLQNIHLYFENGELQNEVKEKKRAHAMA